MQIVFHLKINIESIYKGYVKNYFVGNILAIFDNRLKNHIMIIDRPMDIRIKFGQNQLKTVGAVVFLRFFKHFWLKSAETVGVVFFKIFTFLASRQKTEQWWGNI